MELENITGFLRRNAAYYPNKPAILHPAKITFRQLDREVDYYSHGLINLGIHKGTRTIMLVEAGPDFFVICFALLRIGAVPVMIDPGMGRRAMVRALRDSGATAFIGMTKAHLLRYLYPDSFKNVRIWINTGTTNFPATVSLSSLRQTKDEFEDDIMLFEGETAGIFYTSGSTGPAKGVIYSAGNMHAQVKLMKNHFKYHPDDIDLCTFPLLGLFVLCLGSSVVIADMDPVRPASLDAASIINNLNEHRCTQMFGSPMILRKIVSYSGERQFELPFLRRIISAGAPVHIELIKGFLKLCKRGTLIHTPFGSTEALPVTDIVSAELIERDGEGVGYEAGICVGYPLKDVEIKIIKITNNEIRFLSDKIECEFGEVGEIIVSGPHITEQYLNKNFSKMGKINDPEKAIIWHRMGDLGRIDSEGMLWFYGRKNQMVETKKGPLYTIPTEAVYNKHPDVCRSALVGVLRKSEIIPVICIQTEAGIKKRDLPRIKTELAGISASFETTRGIDEILFHPDFPVDPRHNAKIFREKLAKWAERRVK